MDLTLFHGSDHIVDAPTFGIGKPYNDYGLGFYCTEHRDMASEWAVGFDHDGFANEYRIDLDGLHIVDLDAPDLTVLHWLSVLLQNRWFDVRAPLANEARSYLVDHFDVDLSDADIVTGYRADDSYFTFAQDFINGAISYRQLSNAMHLGDLGKQLMVRSERAFGRLMFIEAALKRYCESESRLTELYTCRIACQFSVTNWNACESAWRKVNMVSRFASSRAAG